MILLKTIFVVFVVLFREANALICSRYPTNTNMPKSMVDENFIVTIHGNPQTYVLGQAYNVTIQAYNDLRFISFKLALENDNGDPSLNEDLGHFEILDPIETRYSPRCINMVESTNTNPKTRIDVTWVAPQEPGNGCVLIRTTLLQHRDVWFMDDGGLTRRICEESVDEVESASPGVERNSCCACDEGRYEIIFEGTWSRNLHPKDFPAKGWITRFSDIIGASHSEDYRFWEYGQLATEGMKEFAEHGSARSLEREFNSNFREGKIRTIIKARGPAFPNLNGQSLASVRVDPKHHLLSLAAKIDPSPDWIVGVSGLELCMSNCTWIEGKTITLYPWDVGTDAGPSYTSPDQPQIPADVIRRMRSDFPNDPRSPFFDESGAPMRPLAILKIRRQRLYERLCEDEDSNNVDIPRECFTHPWTAWSECSTQCGEGRQFRTRVYKQPDVANIFKCEVDTREDRACRGEECGRDERRFGGMRDYDRREEDDFSEADERQDMDGTITRADCQLTGWSAWSTCSRSCGEGKIMRRRQYANPSLERRCKLMKFERLVEYQKCIGLECGVEARAGRWNQAVGEDQEKMDGMDKQEAFEGKEEGADSEMENAREGEAEDGDGNGQEENAAENENREDIEQDNEAPPGFSSWQKGRNKNRNSYGRPSNAQERNQERNGEAGEGEEEEDGGEEDVEENDNDDNEENNSPRNRYGYNNRFDLTSRRREPNNNEADEDETRDNNYDTRAPGRVGYNSRRYPGTGRRNNEIGENDDYPTSHMRGRNRRPNSRMGAEENEETGAEPTEIPTHCFEIPKPYVCPTASGVRNYWFYNYCQNQCMLFTADSCDENENKFNSLEMCKETCQPPGYKELLRRKQRRGCSRTNKLRKQKSRKYSYYRF